MRYIYSLLFFSIVLLLNGCSETTELTPPKKKICKVVIDEPSEEELEKFNSKCTVPKWRY